MRTKLSPKFNSESLIEYATFFTYNEDKNHPLVITVEHAGNSWPKSEPLGNLPEGWQDQHYAYDRGARELAINIGAELGCPVVLGKYSRVLIDLNRIVGAEDIIRPNNDGVDFNMNYVALEEKKTVPTDLLDRRVTQYYIPYHKKVKDLLEKSGEGAKHLCVHSYIEKRMTDTDDVHNPWHVGIQYPHTSPMAMSALQAFRKLKPDKCIGNNQPYNLRNGLPGAISLHAASFGIDTVELEFRDDQLTDQRKANGWLNTTIKWLKADVLGSNL